MPQMHPAGVESLSARLRALIADAKAAGITVKVIPVEAFRRIVPVGVHQGVAARVRSAPAATLEELDAVLARGAALRFLLTRLHDWINHDPGALVRPKDPLQCLAWLRFHQQLAGAADYGF